MNTPPDDDVREGELLILFKADVTRIALSADYDGSPAVVIAGLLDMAEGMMRRAVRLNPDVLPHLVERIDLMRGKCVEVATTASAVAGPRTTNRARTH